MADNPTFRRSMRALWLMGAVLAEDFGVRPTSVTLRVRQYSGPIHAPGTTLTLTDDTVITPRPQVRQVRQGRRADQTGWHDEAENTDATGNPIALRYEVGPIAQESTSGGYDPTAWRPTDDPTRRLTVVLAGDEFGADPVEFELVRVDASDPHTFTVTVQRTRQGA